MSEVVLDASALIAYFNQERGHELVEPYLNGAQLCSVNLSEVAARLIERGHRAEDILNDVSALGVEVVAFGAERAIGAAQLKAGTRFLGLSLGDRACIALGLERAATVLTADIAWAGLEAPHQIEVIR